MEKKRDAGYCQPSSVTREEEEDKSTLGASLAERETERERRENYMMDEEQEENQDTWKPPSHF